MNKKYILLSIILSGAFLLFAPVSAQPTQSALDNLKYPIAELGGCVDQADCQKFCDQSANMLKCVDFASLNGMISKEEADLAKRIIPKIEAGQSPGNCKTKGECEAYCQNDSSHMSECLKFAEEMNILPPDELEQAKKVQKALESGAQLPGGCMGKQKCEAYCQDTTHIEECLTFAEQANILPPQEIAEAKKVMGFLKNGETPGGCKTKKDCNTYCQNDQHFEECISFAEKAGLVSSEEAEMAKKVGGKGPGGCKNKEECATYCDQESNAEECANFAVEKGLVSEEEAQKIKEGASQIKAGLEKIPQEVRGEVERCLSGLFGSDKLNKIKNGETVSFTKTQGDGISVCFNKAIEKLQNIGGGAPPSGGGAIPSGPPAGMPNIGQGGIPGNIPSGSNPPPGYKPDAATCSMFASVPNCDYVPENARAICKQCK